MTIAPPSKDSSPLNERRKKPRLRNHLPSDFTQKIAAILSGNHEDKVTPPEFVLYLLEKHKENGLYTPITRSNFSQKVIGRDHYFAEIYSKMAEGDLLPADLAVALANLTGTNPFFWRRDHYSLAEGEHIDIDMEKEISHSKYAASSSIHTTTEFSKKISDILCNHAEDKVSPVEFVLYLLETHRENGLYNPIARTSFGVKLGRSPHYFAEVTRREKEGAKILPEHLATAMANLTETQPLFWKKEQYSLAEADAIHIQMDKDISASILPSPYTERAARQPAYNGRH